LFDLEKLDADALQRIATKLRSIGFTEDGVRERLQVDEVPTMGLKAFPFYLHDRLARRDPLDVAIIPSSSKASSRSRSSTRSSTSPRGSCSRSSASSSPTA
jgi:hypothetical protein